MPAAPREPSNWRTDALPEPVGARFQTAFGLDRTPASLVDTAVGIRRGLDAAPPGADALAVSDLYEVADSSHTVVVDGEPHGVRSPLDGYVLATLDPRPVEIRSRDPVTGDRVSVTVADGDARVEPSSAAVSVGVPADPRRRDSLTAAAAYETLCPYAGVFTTAETAREWTAGVDATAATVSPADATALGWALTGRVGGHHEPLVDQRGVFSPREW